MKDEIKEMNLSEMLFNRDERLLDYITNLQEENKMLKELNVCVGCNNNQDYKSRNEKAIEYINTEWGCDGTPIDDVLNILQGSDKDGND